MSWNVKVGQRVYHSHTVICILVLAFQIYFEMRGGRTYFDEGLALVCMLYVIILLLKRRLDSSDQISVFLLIVVITIGLLSNAMSGLAYSWFSVFVDVISETKFCGRFLHLNTILHQTYIAICPERCVRSQNGSAISQAYLRLYPSL